MATKVRKEAETHLFGNMLQELESMLQNPSPQTISRSRNSTNSTISSKISSSDLYDFGNYQRISSEEFSFVTEDNCNEVFRLGDELVQLAGELLHLRNSDMEEVKNNIVQQAIAQLEKPLQQKEEGF